MDIQILTELKAKAKGGWWIRPTGEAVPVEEHCGHDATAYSMGYSRSYDDAYRDGCVRISHTDDDKFYVTFWRLLVAPAAIKTALKLIKLYDDMTRKEVEAEARAYWDYPSDPNAHPTKHGEGIEMRQYDSEGVEMKKLVRFLSERLRERQDDIALAQQPLQQKAA